MDAKTSYQEAYIDAFRLIMDGQSQSPEYVALLAGMDAMPGSATQKESWGLEIGVRLYQQVLAEPPHVVVECLANCPAVQTSGELP
jgi:hypothetical protein